MSEGTDHPNGRLQEGADRPSDEQLVAAIRDAKTPEEVREAWRELLVRYQPMMHTLCRQMLGPKAPVEDACHDALIKVMRGLHTFDERARVSTWIYRVTMNCCLSRIRKESRNKAVPLDSGLKHASGPGSSANRPTLADFLPQSREPIPGKSVQQEDQRALVTEALGNLDPDLRSVLLLRDAQGLDYAQIAELLEVRVGTVKSRIFRARLALRQMVESIRAARLGPSEAKDTKG
ncbi:MAG: RNA polymerase sigma factor [Phycisphaerales bacterium JB058]